MQETTRNFTYTAQRNTYLSGIIALGFMVLVDGSVVFILIAALVQLILLKIVLLMALTALYLYLFINLLAPLWTKHRLTATELILHYGRQLHITIPRTAIRAI